MKLLTLLYLRRGDEILLALKKRGFGEGRWNGVGGKVESGEGVRTAAIRECQEEVSVTPLYPRLVGRLSFYLTSDPTFCHNTSIYTATKWHGDPEETEEMRPQWFHATNLPYEHMWPDDRVWLPLLLKNKLFVGSFTIDDTDTITSHELHEVDRLKEVTRP